jgi:hypothetical protein
MWLLWYSQPCPLLLWPYTTPSNWNLRWKLHFWVHLDITSRWLGKCFVDLHVCFTPRETQRDLRDEIIDSSVAEFSRKRHIIK